MDFNKDYILENEFALLRPLTEADYELLLEYAINEPEIWAFNSRGPSNPDNLKKYIETALAGRKNGTEYPFIVHDKVNQKFAGSTRFYSIHPLNKTLELGFTWYGKQFQGTKLNKNCKYLLLEFAFETLNMERVGFRANSLNQKSINAMKSIGCKEEGIMRNYSEDAEGNRIDAIILSIIKQEWFSEAKENLRNKILK
jgi:RimJ/RimL family protein N-acetyltransferase